MATTVQRWTGRETRALRQALRMSIRDFAAHLGVAERTVSKWEAGNGTVQPRPEMQAALDTAFDNASGDAQQRFVSSFRPDERRSAQATPSGSNLAVLARQRLRQTREAAGLSPEDFAILLSECLGWAPTAADVTRWELVAVPPGDVLLALDRLKGLPSGVDGDSSEPDHLAGLTAVYPSRSEFSAHLPADQLLNGARQVRAVGLSLNMLCQDYADRRWRDLMTGGATVRCLFLNPASLAIQARELEEGFPPGQLSALTKLNIETLLRIRDRLPGDLRNNLQLAVYDETLRFNVVLVDELCVAQPYLAERRGVDSPTFVIRCRQAGLYSVFEQIFESQWQRGQQV
ncbi:Helix-turn-helix domain-containing protein [Micromonospora pallida]|uniref:Helix-turn-helix domain-containing protein n=1 Tax=Micromonospora pallida TaxID=145854 RepID=A0A1C6SZ93_9ACTN|nr:DUF5919 domain-containing protein [Micromonospora pallida]SCL34904.1 Helix-turn-helix domain-containing protein [Micromonospora pallida]